MQRSITNKKPVENILYVLLYAIYLSLSSIYIFLPPLLGLLFILFTKALKDDDTISLLFISFCLVLFEADKGYMLFSSVIYFTLLYKFLIPRITQNFSCPSCILLLSIVLVYIGFFFFSTLLSNILLIPSPSINYYIVFYIVIEFFLVSLL